MSTTPTSTPLVLISGGRHLAWSPDIWCMGQKGGCVSRTLVWPGGGTPLYPGGVTPLGQGVGTPLVLTGVVTPVLQGDVTPLLTGVGTPLLTGEGTTLLTGAGAVTPLLKGDSTSWCWLGVWGDKYNLLSLALQMFKYFKQASQFDLISSNLGYTVFMSTNNEIF